MQEQRMNDVDSLDERLTRALERKPAAAMPVDFAARVAGQVPVRKAVAMPSGRYGVMTARIGMGVLLLALVVVAMRSTGHPVLEVAIEWILCAELVGLAAWLSGMWKPMES